MIYKMHKNGSYNIHTIKTDRFKSIRMEIVFRNNVEPKNIAARTCLFEVLLENSMNYPTKRDMVLYQEDLYNSVCYAVSSKVGNEVITNVCMDFLNPKYTEEDYLEDAIKYPFDILFNPNVKDNEFDEVTLETIKTRLVSDIKCIKEDPQKLSLNSALKHMDENSISGISLNGTVESVNAITTSNLYKEYEYVMNHDYVDIFIIGDIDVDRVVDIINRYAQFKTIKNHPITMEVKNSIRKKPQIISEPSKFSQAQVVFVLNIGDLTPDDKRYTFNIYNMILGGGSLETKLYKNLRDKNSLCYNVISIYQKNDNLLLIHTSVDKKNVEKATKLIKDSISEMLTNIEPEEIERAISSIVTSINMSLDEPSRIIDQYLFRYISDLEDVETRINKYLTITKDDIARVAKKVSINTIYTLENGGHHGKN